MKTVTSKRAPRQRGTGVLLEGTILRHYPPISHLRMAVGRDVGRHLLVQLNVHAFNPLPNELLKVRIVLAHGLLPQHFAQLWPQMAKKKVRDGESDHGYVMRWRQIRISFVHPYGWRSWRLMFSSRGHTIIFSSLLFSLSCLSLFRSFFIVYLRLYG